MPSALSKSSQVTLFAHLKARRPEIEEVIVARVHRMAESAGVGQRYVEGLEDAVSAAIDFGLSAFKPGDGHRDVPVPPELLTQARLAARSGAALDAILHQYFAGYSLLSDFLIEEAEEIGLSGAELKRLLRAQTALLDRLIVAVSEEYQLEADAGLDPSERRRVAHVERLLAGEVLDVSEFVYRLEASHVGMIGTGHGVIDAIRDLAKALDCGLLIVRRGEQTAWAWLGAPNGSDFAELDTALASRLPTRVRLAVGEPSEGIAGWRLTHEQAKSAAPIALRGPKPVVRYREVALLVSMLQDALLVRSLRRLYLEPLSKARNGGVVLRQTLRAYFLAERNTSSAAAALGVSRQTVINRLRTVEGLLERRLNGCAMELEAALRLEDWNSSLLLA
jgi:diguanylate cyclase with GGDEF domain/PucR-like helix-turn-helix protein